MMQLLPAMNANAIDTLSHYISNALNNDPQRQCAQNGIHNQKMSSTQSGINTKANLQTPITISSRDQKLMLSDTMLRNLKTL